MKPILERARRRPLGALLLLLALSPGDASAERLPLRVLGSADGLAGDAILTLFEDSRGFLWVGTDSGLSRYDGLLARSYDVRDGLPGPRINDVTETADGSIWVATASGLARLAAGRWSGGEVFEKVALVGDDRGIEVLLPGRDGSLWVGGPELWRLDPGSPHAGAHEHLDLPLARPDVEDLAEDAQGNLWIATARGLLCRRGDGSMDRFDVGGPNIGAHSVVVDARSRLWVGGPGGLYVLPVAALARGGDSAAPDDDGRSLFTRSRPPRFPGELPSGSNEVLFYSSASGLADDFIYSLSLAGATRDGVWVATRGGVTRLLDGTAWSIGTAQGLPEAPQVTVLEDRRGTVWLGSESSGVSRLADSGFVAFVQLCGASHNSTYGEHLLMWSGSDPYRRIQPSAEFHLHITSRLSIGVVSVQAPTFQGGYDAQRALTSCSPSVRFSPSPRFDS